jgi:hypothetical protein
MPESTTDQFGQYKLWLSAQSSDIDVYRLDVIWAPQLAAHFVDLTPHVADIIDDFVPAAIESQTVDGKLSRCRCSSARRRSTTARTFWRNTASEVPDHLGRTDRDRADRHGWASGPRATATCGASSFRARPTRG